MYPTQTYNCHCFNPNCRKPFLECSCDCVNESFCIAHSLLGRNKLHKSKYINFH